MGSQHSVIKFAIFFIVLFATTNVIAALPELPAEVSVLKMKLFLNTLGACGYPCADGCYRPCPCCKDDYYWSGGRTYKVDRCEPRSMFVFGSCD
ncbi:fruit-specific protein [Capsicum chacoense]